MGMGDRVRVCVRESMFVCALPVRVCARVRMHTKLFSLARSRSLALSLSRSLARISLALSLFWSLARSVFDLDISLEEKKTFDRASSCVLVTQEESEMRMIMSHLW